MLHSARRVVELEAPDGEVAKSLEVAGRLWREMVEQGGKRDSLLLALGGGSIGDLGGFVAGAFLRGIPFVGLPTTVLAQVDASVGGKTGVDLPQGKNTVGLFHQPSLVVAETRWLETLPAAEVRAGVFEAVKMAFLLDPALFEQIETKTSLLLTGDPEALATVVAASIAAKAGVVQRDPHEAGERRVLNFGHTLAHALETELGYRGLSHGEAVGWGMRFAVDLALQLDDSADLAADCSRLLRVLDHIGVPTLPQLDVDALLRHMGRDKKATEAGTTWVLPAGLGRVRYERLAEELVRSRLAVMLA